MIEDEFREYFERFQAKHKNSIIQHRGMNCTGIVRAGEFSLLIYKENKLHCDDGPAVISHFRQEWYINHGRHRIDGPAVIHSDGFIGYYINNKCFSYQTWLLHPLVVNHKLENILQICP